MPPASPSLRATARTRARIVALLAATVLIAVAACKDAAAPPPPPKPLIVNGLWDFTTLVASGPQGIISCLDTGSLALTQQGAALTGLVAFVRSCGIPGTVGRGTVFETDSVAGTLSGRTLALEVRSVNGGLVVCADTLMVDTVHTTLAGVGTCGSLTIALTGQVGGAVVSGSVAPDSVTLVTGASAHLTADFRTATGLRALLRPVTWNVANGNVASVSATGDVVALAAGTTTITAASGTRAAFAAIRVPTPAGFVNVGAGNARSCALVTAGSVYCWGVAIAGSPGGVSPQLVGGGLHFVELAVGADHSCARTSANAVWCWGSGAHGQLGTGLVSDASTPQAVQGGFSFVSLSAGGAHTCALDANGAAWCWGADSIGQLGNHLRGVFSAPMAVVGGLTFTALSAGPTHTCGITTGGALYCWGDNAMGQLGDSTTLTRDVPVLVKGGLSWSAVSAGTFRTCGLTTAGAAYCWGTTGFGGALGTGTSSAITPAPVVGGHVFTTISVGGNQSCALDGAHAAWCWGANYFGQVGNGASAPTVSAPAAVTGGLTFATISAGAYAYSDEAINAGTAAHTCAVTLAGITYCWGVNNIGQVGNGTTSFAAVSTPSKVVGQP